MKVLRGALVTVVFCGCCCGVTLAQKTSADEAAKTTPVAQSHEIKSPRDAASGLPTGKRRDAPAPHQFQDGVTAGKPAAPPAVAPCAGPGCLPLSQEHAINTKGTGSNNGRTDPMTQEHAINTKGTGATANGRIVPAAQEHAINEKGHGTAGKAAAPAVAPCEGAGCPPH